MRKPSHVLAILILSQFIINSCTSKKDKEVEEQIQISANASVQEDSLVNSIGGNVTMKEVSSFPNRVILTGLKDHRLISVYKSSKAGVSTEQSNRSEYSYDNVETGDEYSEHFMPGIDILFGYNLLNIVHYDLKQEKFNFLFQKPVLVKSVYYPSYIQDSLDRQPINRNYFLVSAYDADTNKDSLINKRDLRRLFYFNSSCTIKLQLLPSNYSVVKSQYDPKNDVMYVFAREDENKNGSQDKAEQMHIFWFSLNEPHKAKLLY